MAKANLAKVLLRLSLAFSFVYAAIASFLQPTAWLGFFPKVLTAIIPAKLLLELFSVYELLLAGWLLSGKKAAYAALFSALTLAGIVLFNTSQMYILFRDVSLFFAALALVVMEIA